VVSEGVEPSYRNPKHIALNVSSGVEPERPCALGRGNTTYSPYIENLLKKLYNLYWEGCKMTEKEKDDIPDFTYNGYALTNDELERYAEALEDLMYKGDSTKYKEINKYLKAKYDTPPSNLPLF
jgi:hypothetical protein